MAGPGGVVPEGDGGPVVLRTALDWFTVLSLLPVSEARWSELWAAAGRRGIYDVQGAGVALPVELSRLGRDLVGRSVAGVRVLLREPSRCAGRAVEGCASGLRADMTRGCRFRGRPSAGAACLGLDGVRVEGWRSWASTGCASSSSAGCVALDPDALVCGVRRSEGSERREVYGVEVQLQGSLFSSAESGGDYLAAVVWDALARWLYGDRWSDPTREVDVYTRVGRLDVAADAAFVGDDGERFVSWGIYGDGHTGEAFGRWSTRARAARVEETVTRESDAAAAERWQGVTGRRSLLGKETAGRTLYLGSAAYALLCVYERSKKTDGDWSVLAPTLRACGWDGESPVVRAEVRVSRRWLADQVLRGPDGRALFTRPGTVEGSPEHARAVADLTVLEVLEHLPGLVAELPSRFRHTDPTSTVRRRDRPSSAWWSAVSGSLASWRSGSGSVARVVSTRRVAAAARTVSALRSGFVRLVGLRGARDIREVLREVLDAWDAPDFRDGREEQIRRVRSRYGVAAPDDALAVAV